MALNSFDEDEIIPYVAEFDRDNTKDPLIINMKYVPYKMVEKYRKIIARKVKEKSKGTASITKISEISGEVGAEVQRTQFIENVDSIENYFVKGRQIADPGEFYDRVSDDLLTEIIKAMESEAKLSEGQRKNLSGASDGASSQEEKTGSPSTAETVEQENKEKETVTTGEDSLSP